MRPNRADGPSEKEEAGANPEYKKGEDHRYFHAYLQHGLNGSPPAIVQRSRPLEHAVPPKRLETFCGGGHGKGSIFITVSEWMDWTIMDYVELHHVNRLDLVCDLAFPAVSITKMR